MKKNRGIQKLAILVLLGVFMFSNRLVRNLVHFIIDDGTN
ncbi:Uncharacterised protein [Streptococcus pneumoniae]|nr:Uncharacterised protein [Streptococcus pneumoniae]